MSGFFFGMNPNAKNAHGAGLIDPKKVFNPNDINDKALVNQCIIDVQEKLAVLKKMDMKTGISFSASLCFWASSFLSPLLFGACAIGFLSYGLYQLGARQKANEEYQQALKNLIDCSNWLSNSGYINDQCEESGTILRLLAPVMNDEQLAHLPGQCHDFLKNSQENRNSFSSTLNHKLYGFEKGNITDILGAVLSATIQGLKNIIHQVFPDLEKDIIATAASSFASSSCGAS